ncbi:hypothetical protein ACO0K1_17455 [Undibacterium sp. SXout20W]
MQPAIVDQAEIAPIRKFNFLCVYQALSSLPFSRLREKGLNLSLLQDHYRYHYRYRYHYHQRH